MSVCVWITGGAGMVGRNLQERAPEGVAIVATSRQDLDLMDAAAVMAYVAAQKPDVIIHAAGRVGGIHANMADPYGFFMDNAPWGSMSSELL